MLTRFTVCRKSAPHYDSHSAVESDTQSDSHCDTQSAESDTESVLVFSYSSLLSEPRFSGLDVDVDCVQKSRAWGNTPQNVTRANLIQGTDLVYSQTKSRVDSQKHPLLQEEVGIRKSLLLENSMTWIFCYEKCCGTCNILLRVKIVLLMY